MEHHTPTPITGHTALICLLGSPCAHSISPMMHNASFEALGLDYRYLAFDVNEATLPTAVAGLKVLGARGFNLTMPDKNLMVSLCDELSTAARIIGAVVCELAGILLISLGLGLLLTAGLSHLTSGVLSIHITPFFLGSTLLLLLFTLAVSAAVPVVRILGIHPAEVIG